MPLRQASKVSKDGKHFLNKTTKKKTGKRTAKNHNRPVWKQLPCFLKCYFLQGIFTYPPKSRHFESMIFRLSRLVGYVSIPWRVLGTTFAKSFLVWNVVSSFFWGNPEKKHSLSLEKTLHHHSTDWILDELFSQQDMLVRQLLQHEQWDFRKTHYPLGWKKNTASQRMFST